MNSTKVCSVFLLVLCWTTAGSLKVSSQTAVTKQGAAVMFFTAFHGSLREIEFNPIIFNEVVVNQGSGYSNDSGIFTAPVSGIYQFVFAAQLCRGPYDNDWKFMVKGNRMMSCHAQVSGGDTTLNTCYLMTELKAGDRVWMKQQAGSCAWASTISKTITFSGVLLASEGVSTLGTKYGSGSSCPLPSVGERFPLTTSAGRTETQSTLLAITLLLGCYL